MGTRLPVNFLVSEKGSSVYLAVAATKFNRLELCENVLAAHHFNTRQTEQSVDHQSHLKTIP